MAEAISGVPQGSVIGPILFVIYVNDLPDHLLADSLLYADDVKLIAPRNRHNILQNSLNVSASWSKDWELDLNPTKREHLPIGNSIHFVLYTLPSYYPLNTQTIPNVSTTKDLRMVLNTRLSVEDNVVSAANKARRMLFYLKRSFAALTPSIFRPLCNMFIQPYLEYAIQATHPISRGRGIGKGAEARSEIRERASACPVLSSSPTALTIPSFTPSNPWKSNIHTQDYP